MKKLFIRILIFIAPVVIMAWVMDDFISDTLKRSGNFAEGEYPVWNAVFSGEACSDILVYGSSRALFHVAPAVINKELGMSAYNLGINGHTFLLEYFRHKQLSELGCRPGLIVQTLDATTLVKGENLYNPDQFLPYMLYNDDLKDVALQFNGYKPIDFRIPLIRYFGKKEAFLAFCGLIVHPSGNYSLRTRGYRGNEKVWNDDLKDAKEKLGSYTAELDSGLVKLFRTFLETCNENNQQVVLVYTPEYKGGQSFVTNRGEVIELYERISDEYDIPYLDYSGHMISGEIKYFYNTTHLNREGSRLFTEILCNDLEKAGLLKDIRKKN